MDGTDVLTDVEYLRFSDSTIQLSFLFTDLAESVDFNTLTAAQKHAIADQGGFTYDALGGNDVIALPNSALVDGRLFYSKRFFHGADGNDTFVTSSNHDAIDGGAGIDTVVVHHSLAKLKNIKFGFRVSFDKAANTELLTLIENNIDTDRFLNVERVQYSVVEGQPSKTSPMSPLGRWGELVDVSFAMNKHLTSPSTKPAKGAPSFAQSLFGDPVEVSKDVKNPLFSTKSVDTHLRVTDWRLRLSPSMS